MAQEIVLARIYFTDFSEFKIRPVLVLKNYQKEDFLYLPLSTNLNLDGIIITEEDLVEGFLREKSVVVIPKIGILHRDLVTVKIGVLNDLCFEDVMRKVCQSLDCGRYCVACS